MLSNMATSLILHKRIKTTLAKAKALRLYVEPLITKSKDDSTHSRRVVFSLLKNKYAVSELFREVSPKVADRPGGYTRIIKTGFRQGDSAEMCIIELVDFNTHLLDIKTSKKSVKGRVRRTRRKAGDETSSPAKAEKAIEAAPEAPAQKLTEVKEATSPVSENENPQENEEKKD